MASVSKRIWTYQGSEKTAWVVRHQDHKGTNRQKTFQRKKDADTYRHQVDTEKLARGFGAYVEEKTIRDLCGEYIEAQRDRLSDGRITRGRFKNLEMALRVSVVPELGKRKAHELTSADIETWYSKLRRERKLAPVTARARVLELKLAYDFGVRRSYAKTNPVPEALKELRGAPAAPIRTFSHEDIARVLAAVETRAKGQHDRAWRLSKCVVHLAAFCGLRAGEIFALTLDHLDFDARVIEVRHSVTQWDELKAPKTASGVRDVPMPAHIAELLQDWISRSYVANERGLIFRSYGRKAPAGGPINPGGFHRGSWRPILEKAGLAKEGDQLHFHALRHFAASWMIANGLPITDVASLLGHKKFDLTLQIYAHPIVNGTRRLEAFDRMSTALLATQAPASEPAKVARSMVTTKKCVQGVRTSKLAERFQTRKNMVTILAEERLALAVYRPQALIYGAFAGSIAAIT